MDECDVWGEMWYMRLYLDCCCLNRLFDDRSQDRVRIEAEAVELILDKIERGDWLLVASHTLAVEASRTPNPLRRKACLTLIQAAQMMVGTPDAVKAETVRLIGLGIKQMDAAHLASAQIGGADFFLTVEDALLRKAKQFSHTLSTRAESPVTFLMRALRGELS